MNEHYVGAGAERYLAQRAGAASARVQALRASMFADLAGADRRIVDFGCGTGGILGNLPAASRTGVEVSEAAAAVATAAGITIVTDPADLPAQGFDVAISFHAIEHVDNPLEALRSIGRLVVPDGRIRLVVPCETPFTRDHRRWQDNEYRHLHTWTPLVFGNLAQRAGYRDIRSRLAPMPTGSRLIRLLAPVPPLARAVNMLRNIRRNSLSVVLDAKPPLDH